MNKKKINYIIALMSVALAGIIMLQVYWIKHDIDIKEKQFSQGVNQALAAVIDKVESREAFHMIKNRLFDMDQNQIVSLLMNDSNETPTIPVSSPDPEFYIPQPPPLFDDLENADINIEFHKPGSTQTILRLQRRNYHESDSNVTRTIKSSKITRIYDNKAEVVIQRKKEKIKSKMDQLNRVMEQFAVEYVGKETDIKQRITPQLLDTVIQSELNCRGLNLKYDFAVLNANNNQLILSNCNTSQNEIVKSPYKAALFPNDFDMPAEKPNFLFLHFPDVQQYVLNSMWPMLIASFVFTFIIIFGFTYTIQTIFRQKKLSDIKSDFINNMTHEFKTPIATISLAIDSIKNPKVLGDSKKLDYFTNVIRSENKRMNSQVENVLQMAQIEKGELKLNLEDINMHDVILKAAERMMVQVESREGKIDLQLNSTQPIIKGDYIHLTNIITNLLDNANKYSASKPEITVTTVNALNGINIIVEDKGMGMTVDTQKKIFEKFYRVTSGNIHDIKGFGLGLSYVKAIIEQHKGNIEVKSIVNEGSTFSIFVPFQ